MKPICYAVGAKELLSIGVLTLLLTSSSASGQAIVVPPTDIINRVMQIQYSNNYGTTFTIEVDKRQYLITARHILLGIKSHDEIKVKNFKEWVTIPVTQIGCDTNSDIAVLVPPTQLTTAFPIRPTMTAAILGQDIYFLGFPYGLYVPMQNFTAAFIKKGILSSEITNPNGIRTIFLDGHNNPGFSGGPIVFKRPDSPEWNIGGVVSGYVWKANQVISVTDTNSFIKENTGIVIGEDIDSAIKAIKANPVGPLVTY